MTDQVPGEEPEILVLAAGRARRFGADKRRAYIAQDETLLGFTVAQLLRSGLPVTVCLASRRSDDALAGVLGSTGARILRCVRAEEGMASTLAEAVAARARAPAILVALGDMPLVSPGTVQALTGLWRPASIVIPVGRDGRRGHPVLFDRAYFGELRALSGDRGAASLLRRYEQNCVELPVDDPGIHLDADTPDALESLCTQLTSRRSSGVSG